MSPWKLLPMLALLAVSGVACAEKSERTAGTGGAPAGTHEVDLETATVTAQLAQVRGHHRVALELYEMDDLEGAAAHAGHPVDELLPALSEELGEHGGDVESLESSLRAVVDAVSGQASVEELRAAIDDAAAATESNADAMAGGEQDAALIGTAVAMLLDVAAHEYEEAVGDAGIEHVDEYQEGYGFAAEAKDLYEGVRADVEEASAEEAEEIEEGFAVLDRAFPAVAPPEDLVPAEEVESAAKLVAHELEETVHAAALEESDPAEVVAEIEKLLAEIEETYAAGDADAAAELSAEAYLENYEVIEPEVIELAPDVNEELEPLLGADLRRQIQAGASEEEIATMLERARELLQTALTALEGAH